MTPNYDLKEAAEQTRKSYSEVTAKLGLLGFDTAIPEAVRTMAETSVAQTRQATDRSIDAFETSVASFEKSFDAAGQGAAAFNRKFIDLARRNLNSELRPGQEPGWRQETSPTWWNCRRPFGARSSGRSPPRPRRSARFRPR